MCDMTKSPQIPELIFSGLDSNMSKAIEVGHRSFMLHQRDENMGGYDLVSQMRARVVRELGPTTLYIRYGSYVTEHQITERSTKSLVHPVWNYTESGIDVLVPMLRGEWDGHDSREPSGEIRWVGPAEGQKEYKVFLAEVPVGKSVPGRMLARFISDARARNLIVPELYFETVAGLASALNFQPDGLVYNPDLPAARGVIITGQGRKIEVRDRDEVMASRRVITKVGYEPLDLVNGPTRDLLLGFNVVSAIWATKNWHKGVMPVGPKARGARGRKATV